MFEHLNVYNFICIVIGCDNKQNVVYKKTLLCKNFYYWHPSEELGIIWNLDRLNLFNFGGENGKLCCRYFSFPMLLRTFDPEKFWDAKWWKIFVMDVAKTGGKWKKNYCSVLWQRVF